VLVAGFLTNMRGRGLWRESDGSSTGSERKFLLRKVGCGGKNLITRRSFQHSPSSSLDAATFSTPAAFDQVGTATCALRRP